MKQFIKEDIFNLLYKYFERSGSTRFYISKSKFFTLFISEYPLKYKTKDKLIINSDDLLKIIKEMNICSPFRFRKKKVKRYKFIKRRILNYER
jgi:hypothetical protein